MPAAPHTKSAALPPGSSSPALHHRTALACKIGERRTARNHQRPRCLPRGRSRLYRTESARHGGAQHRVDSHTPQPKRLRARPTLVSLDLTQNRTTSIGRAAAPARSLSKSHRSSPRSPILSATPPRVRARQLRRAMAAPQRRTPRNSKRVHVGGGLRALPRPVVEDADGHGRIMSARSGRLADSTSTRAAKRSARPETERMAKTGGRVCPIRAFCLRSASTIEPRNRLRPALLRTEGTACARRLRPRTRHSSAWCPPRAGGTEDTPPYRGADSHTEFSARPVTPPWRVIP